VAKQIGEKIKLTDVDKIIRLVVYLLILYIILKLFQII